MLKTELLDRWSCSDSDNVELIAGAFEHIAMSGWQLSTKNLVVSDFSPEKHVLASVEGLLDEPEVAIQTASLQNFAKITPQYPGVRAPLGESVTATMLTQLSPMLSEVFGKPAGLWDMVGWYSLVTSPPQDLLPIQRLPHVDGTDPDQIAMMLYLHRTHHGGTAFFRHKSTGLEALTASNFPRYRDRLQSEVAAAGLPPARYVTDGAPFFEVTHEVEGKFNQAVFYRGNILHSGVIDNTSPLSADPEIGRLTINAFLRPPQ